ncbi:hypothetical protein [Methylocystis sp. Sn-Cys]|uniref:hypothetical protein n=1 Tax=Methylocystis sp. Sn-Cys TaxID=1701263 RepID=UPI0019219237|nr:hypothetical protein [Methylocystis sp. Sn-Cys]MBL1258390.1 hypothetical protein [Methylocystis sp. Sn-Cys]
MRKLLALSVAFCCFSGAALASSYGSITQFVGGVDGALALQQAQIGQNTGKGTDNLAHIGQYIFGASAGSVVIQNATINQITVAPLSPFSNGF